MALTEKGKQSLSYRGSLQVRAFGRNDVLFLFGLFVLLGLFCVVFFYRTYDAVGSKVVVTVDGVAYGTYALDTAQTVSITDAEGNVTNELRIENGAADMTGANCPDRLCVHQKPISHPNENLICLPNRVIVTVVGDDSTDIDSVSQ